MPSLSLPRLARVALTTTASAGLLIAGACRSLPPSAPAAAPAPRLKAGTLAAMDQAVLQAIADHRCPGGVLWVEHDGAAYHKAYGDRALTPAVEPMTEDTIFDAASLTKVIACTPAVMRLVEQGRVRLDDPVSAYIPEFTGGGKEAVTVRQLMTHTSGLRPDIETRSDWTGNDAAIRKACEEKLQTPPGAALRYSDINFFLLGEIVRRASGTPLEKFVAREIFEPLRMTDTGYLPPESRRGRIAPTEVVNGTPWRGVVHDPTARKMGGVAGHAGLFTTAADLARYARMLLNEGELDGVRVLRPETVRMMTRVQTPASIPARRGLGWDIDSGHSGPRGTVFPAGSSYGHTGWTGTSIWIDPRSRTFVIFLSNRNHPTEQGSVGELRATLGTLAAEAVADFAFARAPGAPAAPAQATAPAARPAAARRDVRPPVLNGIDVLVRRNFAPLRGLKVGLITNLTGHDRDRRSTADLLRAAPGVELKALFSPEHGLAGNREGNVGDATDEHTGLPVYSLYGTTNRPTPKQLEGLDALVFDIQDIGCRFYTYIATMDLAMQSAAENGKKFFVLDRVNPITGGHVEGSIASGATMLGTSHRIPLRHGMTAGELATLFNAGREGPKTDLTVIPVENWRREQWLDQTGLPWTNPSPNMRNLKEAILYPGIGLLERAMSVGRGTDTPFEVAGAPGVDDRILAAELNAAGLPGIRFVPVRFTPTTDMHEGKECGGVYLLLTDRAVCPVVDVGLTIAKTMQRLFPDSFQIDRMRHLLSDDATLEAIRQDRPLDEIHARWKKELRAFMKRREKCLLYR